MAELRCASSSRISEPSLVVNGATSLRFIMSIDFRFFNREIHEIQFGGGAALLRRRFGQTGRSALPDFKNFPACQKFSTSPFVQSRHPQQSKPSRRRTSV